MSRHVKSPGPRSVVHVLGSAQPEGTGIAELVCGLAQSVDPARYRLEACFLWGGGPLVQKLRDNGIKAAVVDFKGRSPVGAWSLYRHLAQRNLSIVHQHVGGRAVSLIARWATGAKLVVHVHGRIAETGNLNPEPHPVRLTLPDAVIASCQAAASSIVNDNVEVIYGGVDLPYAANLLPGDGQRSLVIGMACRLVPVKGVLNLIRAMPLVQQHLPNVVLQIAGTGPEHAGLKTEVQSLGIEHLVEFLGWVPDLSPLLREWGVFVLPSLEESFPVACLQAMAAGVPVVATSVGGMPELVVDGETGWLVAPRSPSALAGKITELLQNPEARFRMGCAGRERVRQHFSRDRMAESIVRLYDRLLRTNA